MKKSLLLFTAVLSGLTLSAQNSKHLPAGRLGGVKVTGQTQQALTEEVSQDLGYQPRSTNTAKIAIAPYSFFSSARNAFGFIVSESTCLTYNADLNAVVFTQRNTQDWPNSAFPTTPGAGASGYLVTKWSVDNGQTWDSTCYWQSDVNWLRYPSGVVLNPAGNTTIANARVVAFGPTTVAATGWYGNAFASSPLNGLLSTLPGKHTQTTNDQQWFAANSSPAGKNIS